MRAWRHGMKIGDLYAMYARQRGRCYLCKVRLAADLVGAVIDHDHSCCDTKPGCGKCVRGIACARCNILIGMAKDSPELLRRAATNLAATIRGMRPEPESACSTCLETLRQCSCAEFFTGRIRPSSSNEMYKFDGPPKAAGRTVQG